MRKACRLRQIDVYIGTGIPIRTISLAERGLLQLSDADHAHIIRFLEGMWDSYADEWVESKKTPAPKQAPSKTSILRFPLRKNGSRGQNTEAST